jgi:hypothetical protein
MSMKGQATGTIRVYSSCVTAQRYSYLYLQHLRCCAGSFQNVLADASTLGYDSVLRYVRPLPAWLTQTRTLSQ